MIWFSIFVVVHLSFVQGVIPNPTVEITEGTATVNAGSNLQLNCSIETDITAVTFKWFKNNSQVPDEISQTLNITNITKEKAGVYSCTAKNGSGSEMSSSKNQSIVVNYLENAGLTISPTSTTPNEGDSITFNCGVDTNLNPVFYSFQKDGNVITTGGNNVFIIPKANESDSGSYTCTVSATTTSPLSVTSNAVSLTVNELFQTPTLAASPNNLNSGETFTLTCTTSSPRNIVYKFRKGTVDLTQFQSSAVYNITTQTSDSGFYRCIAQVNKVEKVSSQVTVEVTLKVSITITPTVEGQNMNITCNVEGGEEAQSFSWKKNRVSVTEETSKTLVVQNVQRSMIGINYSCIATSQASNQSNEAFATLSNANIYYNASELIFAPSNKNEGKVGEKFSMTCYASDYGNPQATLAWYRNGIATPTEQPGKLVSYDIDPVTRDSTGDYICKAKNTAGEVEKTFTFTSIDKPDSPTLNISSKTSTSITVLITPPAYTGNKPITYYMLEYKGDGKSISKNITDLTNLMYTIPALKPAVDYQLRVQAVNVIGAGEFSEFVIATTGDASPPPLDKDLPDPPADRIEETSFAVNILKFKETNGKIAHYDVIAVKRTHSLYSKNPQDIKNNEIKTFVVGRLYKVVDNQLFTVGGGQTSKRKRRALGIPNNGELEKDTTYVVFVRAYVNENLYQSTKWYTPVKTAESEIGVGTIVGIIVGILIAICLVIIIVLLLRARKSNRDDIDIVENKMRKKQKSIRHGPSPTDRDPRIPVPLKRFEDHVNRLKANSNYEFSQEYSMISRELEYPYSHSRSQDNNIKNRYHNVPSYDDTRVLLSIIDDEPHTDYINANYIGGFERENEYIGTQGPLPETIFDFWRMTWECEVTTIVMLTRLEEKGRVKCAQYWPDSGTLSLKDIVITSTEVHNFPDHVVRTFHVTRTGQAIERIVKQFHFTAWPDFGVPDDPSALLSFLRKVNNWKGMSQGPIIVHCSAGVGRTGTYITIDTQIKNIKTNKEITIFTNVTNIREQRCLMVQTEDQYIFIHAALLDYLESGDTEIEANALREYIKKQSQVDSRTGMTGLMEEFIKLAKTDKKDKFQEANKNVNQTKNRYKNVYPYDETRVRLSQRPGSEGSDYINANYIDSYAAKDYFIATQAPLESTIGDFWRMIWEQNCATIVMLSKEVEGGQVKVHPYWPQKSSSKVEHFIVELTSVTTYGDHIVRELKLTNTDTSTSRNVKQFQYTTWPESGSPESGIGIIQLIGQVQKWNSLIDNKMITVHCSAGVGRTGVFIALTNLIERVKTEAVVDVFQTVKKMRQQRTAMVQTRDQYEFCFRALQEYMDSFDLYANFS
ncbi:receptor-type tyrosine-protein phosphatase F-like isoform X2 [Hydractinia symbiolongicarpus]|uniref:receptor-type tyrosine-protein phosphatase F-like isoform X2 n=1 Tax=Hydractinia symbiolongicarpus TaxID=13093 RepID=UPI00254B515A|nr:receptor-type tyrosine-protein phosphatase F-like isoform X2 [Hydractinia symbiolongicarpus]